MGEAGKKRAAKGKTNRCECVCACGEREFHPKPPHSCERVERASPSPTCSELRPLQVGAEHPSSSSSSLRSSEGKQVRSPHRRS